MRIFLYKFTDAHAKTGKNNTYIGRTSITVDRKLFHFKAIIYSHNMTHTAAAIRLSSVYYRAVVAPNLKLVIRAVGVCAQRDGRGCKKKKKYSGPRLLYYYIIRERTLLRRCRRGNISIGSLARATGASF